MHRGGSLYDLFELGNQEPLILDACSVVGQFLSKLGNQGPLVLEARSLVCLFLYELGIKDLPSSRHARLMGNFAEQSAPGRHAVDHANYLQCDHMHVKCNRKRC